MGTEKYASIIAALEAGKIPSQKQINQCIAFVQRLIHQAINQDGKGQSSDIGRLSSDGAQILGDVNDILEAYKDLANQKNGDDILQEAVWNLSQVAGQGGVETDKEKPGPVTSKQEAKNDAQALSQAIREFGTVLISHLNDTSLPLLSETLSFLRLSLSDVAENVEETARSAKDELRGIEHEIQGCQRDSLGREREEEGPPNSADNVDSNDPKIKLQRGMDAAKYTGLSAIGAVQQSRTAAVELKDKSRAKVLDAFDRMILRALNDPEYNHSLETILDLMDKWVDKSFDAADRIPNELDKSSLDRVISDPNGQLSTALHQLNTFLERLSGGKSTQSIVDYIRRVGKDIRYHTEARQVLPEALQFVHQSLSDAEFVRSDEFDNQKLAISRKWRSMVNADAPESRLLKSDIEKFRDVVDDFQTTLVNEPCLKRLRIAFDKFGKGVAEIISEGTTVAHAEMPWVWKDIITVYLPLALDYIKNIPIPRTEYKDHDIEFVAENISIESLHLLPGHAHISSTVGIDIDKSSGSADAKTDISHKTHLKLSGVQMNLKEVSFWYHDPSLKFPSEVSGLMNINLPPGGVDIDVDFGLLPTLSGKQRREKKQSFHYISEVRVTLSRDTAIALKKTNHPILISTFKRTVKKKLIHRIETVLSQQIKVVLEMVDNIAWDLHQRAKAFDDTELTDTGPKYVAATFSEWRRLRKQPGLLSGWIVTTLGVVKEDPGLDITLAFGAGPQVSRFISYMTIK
ncbi:hypothetical protein CPB86DRAFT_24838 [Serendipita vermifera]|nr:hypothetical protein CPB86DRAFT_24838 [Serendipita vermifera]